MIQYHGSDFWNNIVHYHGSVFPGAIRVALPVSMLTAFIVYGKNRWESFSYFEELGSVGLGNSTIWGSFNFIVGFLVIFRTQQSYCRFWEGVTSAHKMGAEWFDSCSSMIAFCRRAKGEPSAEMAFKNTLVRLFSLLNAAALAEIQDFGKDTDFIGPVIDVASIDSVSLDILRDSGSKVELLFQWIQTLAVEGMHDGILNVPPPILTRAFQELSSGMVHFHEALKISEVPFPFPYAQTCDVLLSLHWLFCPFVVSVLMSAPHWAAAFCFIQVFTLWTLNMIGVELENPFGNDANDMNGAMVQREVNVELRLLISASTSRVPMMRCDRGDLENTFDCALDDSRDVSFTDAVGKRRRKSRFNELSPGQGGFFKTAKAVVTGVKLASVFGRQESISPKSSCSSSDNRAERLEAPSDVATVDPRLQRPTPKRTPSTSADAEASKVTPAVSHDHFPQSTAGAASLTSSARTDFDEKRPSIATASLRVPTSASMPLDLDPSSGSSPKSPKEPPKVRWQNRQDATGEQNESSELQNKAVLDSMSMSMPADSGVSYVELAIDGPSPSATSAPATSGFGRRKVKKIKKASIIDDVNLLANGAESSEHGFPQIATSTAPTQFSPRPPTTTGSA